MRDFIISFCVASALCFAAPANAQIDDNTRPPLQTRTEGVYAGAGPCIYAPETQESAATPLISGIVTQAVKSFATLLAEQAKARTESREATVRIDNTTACIQFVRGSLDLNLLTVTQDEAARTLASRLVEYGISERGSSPEDREILARTLIRNGLPLAGSPHLLVEARLVRIHLRPNDAAEHYVLDPTYIQYGRPIFSQWLRFWSGERRSFAMQVQVAEFPALPAANAPGSSAAVGRFQIGQTYRLIPDGLVAPTPRASSAFQLAGGKQYTARISVSETSSASAFLSFWAGVTGQQSVQTALVQEGTRVLDADARDTADQTAYNTARTALVTLLNARPAASPADAASAWVRLNRENLIRALAAYNDAADLAGREEYSPDIPASADVTAVFTWIDNARPYFETH